VWLSCRHRHSDRMSFDKDSWEMNVMVGIVADKKGMVFAWSAFEPAQIDLIRAGSPWVCLERHSGVLMGAANRQLYCQGGRARKLATHHFLLLLEPLCGPASR
jgi:hypothetical protein